MHRRWFIVILILIMMSGCSSPSGPNRIDEQRSDIDLIQAPTTARNDDYEAGEASSNNGSTAVDCIPSSKTESDWDDAQSGSRHTRISISPKTNSSAAEDGTTIFYESYDSIEFNAQDPELDTWGDSIVKNIEQEFQNNSSDLLNGAKEHHRDYKETFYTYSNYLNVGVARHDSRVISILTTGSMYSGGAHPITLQSAYNLDLQSKQVLTLEQVLVADSADEFHQLLLGVLNRNFNQIGQKVLYDDYTEIIKNLVKFGEMTPNWYFSQDGLVVYFNQYELAPYAAGIIKVDLAYDTLHGILKDEFFPKREECSCGELVILQNGDGFEKIPVNIAEGSQILIGTTAPLYQLQLSEINWLDGTPISKRAVLSMDSFEKNHVLEITGGFDDNTRSFALEYYNGLNEHEIYYIHPDGISDKP